MGRTSRAATATARDVEFIESAASVFPLTDRRHRMAEVCRSRAGL
jgi:hypothetical protein